MNTRGFRKTLACAAAAAAAVLASFGAAEAVPILSTGASCVFPSGLGGSLPNCDTALSGQVCKWSNNGRCGTAYVPSGMGTQNVKAVFFFHGGGDDAASLALQDRYFWNAKAEDFKFLVFYPQALGSYSGACSFPTWNAKHCCGEAFRTNRPDVNYAKSLADSVKAIVSPSNPNKKLVNPDRLFATGISNGGMLVHRLATEKPYLYARVAVVSGTAGGNGGNRKFFPEQGQPITCAATPPPGGTDGDCSGQAVLENAPTAPVGIMMIHGEDDEYVDFDGGRSEGTDLERCDLSQYRAATLWANRNAATWYILDEEDPSGYTFSAASGFAPVVHVTANGTGHGWPGQLVGEFIDPAEHAYTGTDVIWDNFFGNFGVFP